MRRTPHGTRNGRLHRRFRPAIQRLEARELLAATIADPGFESVDVGTGPLGYAYDPTGSPWAFQSSSGITGNGSAFTGTQEAPEGGHAAFIQGYGRVEQSVPGWDAGNYQISLMAGQRSGTNHSYENFQVLVDGAVVTTITPSDTSYRAYSTPAFRVAAGTHTISLQGLNTNGDDNTAFVDEVAVVPAPSNVLPVGDPSFESVALGSGFDAYQYDPVGSPWAFSPESGTAGAGESANDTAFTGGNAVAPDGVQVAFLKAFGTISQSIPGWAAGTYSVSFQAAQRANWGGPQDFQVLIDGSVVGTFQPTAFTYRTYTTAAFPVAAGDHVVTFQGLNTAGGDNTAFLDAINVTKVGGLSDESNDTIATATVMTPVLGTIVRHQAVIGDGDHPTGDVDLYRVALAANQRLLIAVEARNLDEGGSLSNLDSYLRVFDASGNQLASNDDSANPFNNTNSYDSSLTFVAPTAGDYYIGVTGYNNSTYDPNVVGSTTGASTGAYRLELMLSNAARIAAPTGLTAVGAGVNQINLTWSAVAGATGYTLERSSSGTNGWSPIQTLGAGTTNYADMGLTAGTTWYYRVQATSGDSVSAYTTSVQATTSYLPPGNLLGQARSSSEIDLSWSNKSTSVINTYVEESLDGTTNWRPVGSVAGSVTAFKATGPFSGSTNYYFRIRNYFANNSYSDYSDVAVVATLGWPSPPRNISVRVQSATQNLIRWTASSGATSYTVLRSVIGSGTWSPVGTAGGDSTSFTDSTASVGVNYAYQVQASNDLGSSAASVAAYPRLHDAIRDSDGFLTNLAPNDDGSTGLVDIGFTIKFGGSSYTQLYVNNNGNVTFTGPMRTYTPFNIKTGGTKLIAPFFADVDTRNGGGTVTYGTDSLDGHNAFGVDWNDVGYFPTQKDKTNTFQLILIDRSDVAPGAFQIEFNYDQITWETGSASGGQSGFGGTPARAGFGAGSAAGDVIPWEAPGSGTSRALLDSNAATGLISHKLNSDVLGRYDFLIPNGPDLDVDSENQYGFDPNFPRSYMNGAEDRVENQDGTTGRVLYANAADTNGNGVPDYAEGYIRDGNLVSTPDVQFVPLILELPEGVDLSQLRLKFDYSASDPAGVTTTAGPDGPVYSPADGRLRIWTKDGGEDRDGRAVGGDDGGDFVPSGTPIKPSDIGMDDDHRVITLWLEAVSSKPDIDIDGAADKIKVSVDPDGDGPAAFGASDTVRVTVEKSIVVFVNLDETQPDVDPVESRGLTQAEIDRFNANRSQWLQGLGTPTVPSSAYGYSDLVAYVSAAETMLNSAKANAANLAEVAADKTASAAAYLSAYTQAVYSYDQYIYKYQQSVMVKRQFLDDQLWLSSSDEALLARVDALPIHIDGINAQLTADQWDGLRQVHQDVGETLEKTINTLDYTEGALQGAQQGLIVGGAFIAAGLVLPVATLAVGGGLLIGGIGQSLSVRQDAGQNLTQILVGTGSDVTGINSIYMGLTGTDIATGQPVAMTANEQGKAFGSGLASLALTIGAGAANGGPTNGTTTIKLPDPAAWARAVDVAPRQFSLAGLGSVVPEAVPLLQPVAVPLSVAHLQVVTQQLGATQVIVYMTARPGIGGSDYKPEDYPDDDGDNLDLQEIEARDTSYHVGEQEGRNYLKTQRNLQETDFVNPLEHNGKYGNGFDDVLQDANGDYWIAEYKGGDAVLTTKDGKPEQLSRAWVEDVLHRMDRKAEQMGADGDPWAAILDNALENGKLHGIAVKTPYVSELKGQYGVPFILKGPIDY